MIELPKIEAMSLVDKRVFLRVDLNVPLEDGRITSDARIQAALPSILHVIDHGGSVALASHLGRPKGKRTKEDSLEPVGARLSELLGRDVVLADDCVGDGVKTLVREQRPGDVLLLENLRFHAGEEANDPAFAKALAAPFNVYINDAFGASHRAHASIVGMVPLFRERAGGYLMSREITALSRLLDNPGKPFVAVIGGAKVSDKLGVLESLLGRVDAFLIGGAMAYTFMKAKTEGVGASRVEEAKLAGARQFLEYAAGRGVDVLLPVDHVVADRFDESATAELLTEVTIPAGKMGLDIGPKTRAAFAERIQRAKTVFWNGPMGVFEWQKFAAGTRAVAEAVSKCDGYTVVGGGDSVAAIEAAGVSSEIDHVSTGGGASLELLELGTLPGIQALRGEKVTS
jgi:phosphoglycerate kinase